MSLINVGNSLDIGSLMSFNSLFNIIFIAFELFIIGKVVEKMGEPSWKGWIPVYNKYVIFSRTWNVGAFFAYIALMAVSITALVSVFSIALFGGTPNFVASIFIILISIILIAINGIYYYKCAKAFDLSGWFVTIGLLTPIVFYAIIGFGSSVYLENREEDDFNYE